MAAGLLAWGLAGLAGRSPTSPAAQPLPATDLRAEATALLRELARLRGRAASRPAPSVVIRPRDERRVFIEGELRRKYPPARVEAEQRALVAWGLIPAGFDLGTFLVDLVLEQAAAYYDPRGKVMVLAPWLGPAERREALAHELVHALQDEVLDLDRFLSPGPGRSDEALARQSLVEGEAVALTLDLALRRQGRTLEALPDVEAERRAILTAGTGPVLGRAPPFLRAMLTAPYGHGLAYVHRALRAGSWVAVEALYRDPPRSTAEVLHGPRPAGAAPLPAAVDLPDLVGALGPGSRLVMEDQVGELTLREILGLPLQHPGLPGWRGDRHALWSDAGGRDVLVAAVTWATEEAAAGFTRLYEARLQRKHGAPPSGARPATWLANGRADAVARDGRLVVAVEGAGPADLPALVRLIRDRTATVP